MLHNTIPVQGLVVVPQTDLPAVLLLHGVGSKRMRHGRAVLVQLHLRHWPQQQHRHLLHQQHLRQAANSGQVSRGGEAGRQEGRETGRQGDREAGRQGGRQGVRKAGRQGVRKARVLPVGDRWLGAVRQPGRQGGAWVEAAAI